MDQPVWRRPRRERYPTLRDWFFFWMGAGLTALGCFYLGPG